MPLIEMAATRQRAIAAGARINTLSHSRNLLDHTARMVTSPNNDTLYSSGMLDLSQGPITLVVPPSGDRYVSLALMDAYTNNFAILGTRTTGPGGGAIRLVGPNDAAIGGAVVRSPTNSVWALARILVAGPDDLDAARAVQAGFSVQGQDCPLRPDQTTRASSWQDYFKRSDELMMLDPPAVTDQALLLRTALLNLGGGMFDPGSFTAAEGQAIALGVAEARARLRRAALKGAGISDGWTYPPSAVGNFGQDYLLRAIVALSGLAALPPVEAMYMRPMGPDGPLFDGHRAWRLHFSADQLIPVHGFWSLSLYEATTDGQFFFCENVLNRFVISDRTPGLAYDDAGGLDLWIGHESPGRARESNWLPAPPGPYSLSLRAYLPQDSLLSGAYRLPPLQAAN